jgi:predicted neuraminidase
VRAFDPCLWHDPTGRLWLFWAQGYERHTDERSGVWAIITTDAGREDPDWSEPRRLCDGVMMNKPLVLSTGAWLLPAASWKQAPSARVVSSRDQGQTWCELGGATIPNPAHRNCDEHMLVERLDGALWMLVRTNYGIGESTSSDGGMTWSPVTPSEVQHTTSRFFIRRLASGRLFLVKHGPVDARTDRSRLTAYLSEDDGATWSTGLLVDERVGVSYPDAVQADDGTVYLIYDYDRRGAKEILVARFTEQDVLSSTLGSPRAATRLLVNRATGEPMPSA